MTLDKASQNGNVLFLILIAVALFAALSYAVTQSTRSGGGDAGRETTKVRAAQMLASSVGMRTAATRMVINGVDPDDIILSTVGCGTIADICRTGTNCLFATEGGGATPPTLPPTQQVCFNTQSMNDVWYGIAGLGRDFSGTPPNATGFDINLEILQPGWDVCQEINRTAGITSMPQETNNADHILDDGGIPGNTDFCMQWGGPQDQVSYFTVIYSQ